MTQRGYLRVSAGAERRARSWSPAEADTEVCNYGKRRQPRRSAATGNRDRILAPFEIIPVQRTPGESFPRAFFQNDVLLRS